jgi:hypothetical protein
MPRRRAASLLAGLIVLPAGVEADEGRARYLAGGVVRTGAGAEAIVARADQARGDGDGCRRGRPQALAQPRVVVQTSMSPCGTRLA